MWNLEKKFFFSLQKLFSFTRKSNFRTLNIDISWNAWNKKCILLSNLWSKHSRLMKFGQFMSYYKRKKNYQKILQKLRHENENEMKFLKQATYIRYVLAKLSKYVQISTLTSSDSFLQRIHWKLKRTWVHFSWNFFIKRFL